MRCTFAVGLVLATLAASAAAQEEKLETIVVTGSRLSYRDLLDTPAVSIRRPADYLLLGVTLVNDTRSEAARHDEIYATIRKMTAAAGKRFDLVYGDTFLTVVGGDGGEKIPLGKDDKRPDVSRASLFVRASIGGDPSRAEALTRDLREFVAKAERVGRTEIDADAETALSLTRPERFRYDLVKAIADDTGKVRAELGNGCEVSIDGLSSRIEWQRVSASELMLYIPYTMTIDGCGPAG